MTYDNYVLHLNGTIDSYSTKIKKHLVKKYEEDGIIVTDNQMTIYSSQDSVDVIDLGLQEQLKKCLNNSQTAVQMFEKWEFTKDYRYSALFEAEDFEFFLSACEKFEDLSGKTTCENEHLDDTFMNPIRYENNDLLMLKFCLNYSTIEISGAEILFKYPVLLVCHKKISTVEIRFDTLKKLFIAEKDVQRVYINIIDNILKFCENSLKTKLNAMNLDFIISDVKDTKGDSNVRLMSQYTRLAKGGNAQLEVGKNEDYILPIIGELKELLSMPNHIIELEKSPQLKSALNQFIFENEELSDYSWIEVMWGNEVKTRSIRVKFIFNYMHNGYCLLQHYYNNVLVGMERMNDVTEYIVKRKNST